MKPNNLIALLVAIILLAIGIALAVIHQREEDMAIKPGSDKTSYLYPIKSPVITSASGYS